MPIQCIVTLDDFNSEIEFRGKSSKEELFRFVGLLEELKLSILLKMQDAKEMNFEFFSVEKEKKKNKGELS